MHIPEYAVVNMTAGSSGTIKSPYFPVLPYEGNSDFRWNIHADSNSTIRLLFAFFDTQEGSDYIYVSEQNEVECRNSQTWKLNRCSFLRCMTDLRWIPALSWRKRGQCQRLLQFIRRRMKSLSDLCPMMTSRYTLDFSLCTRQFESFDFQEKTWRRYLRTGQFLYSSGNVLLPNILVGSSEILAEYERLTNWL